MGDYRQRMRDEYEELCGRLTRLEAIINGAEEGTLGFDPSCPIPMLEVQAMAMRVYKGCLERRNDIEGAW